MSTTTTTVAFYMPEPHGIPPPPPSSSPPYPPSSSQEPTKPSDMSNVYLMTFVITLIILLSISAAIIGRSMILRRRFRQRVTEAIRAGVLTPDGRFPDPPGQGANREKPKMWDVWLDQRSDTNNVDEKPRTGRFDWKDVMPISATIIRQPSKPPTPEPHVSAIERARELFGNDPVNAPPTMSTVTNHFANVGLIASPNPRDRTPRAEVGTNSNESRNSSIFFREPSLLYSRQRRARAQADALHTATRATLAAQQPTSPPPSPSPTTNPSPTPCRNPGSELSKQTLAVSVLIAMPCPQNPQYIRPSSSMPYPSLPLPPPPPLSSFSPDSPASTLLSCSASSSITKIGSPDSFPSKSLQKSPFRFSSSLSPYDEEESYEMDLPEVMIGTAELEWLAENSASVVESRPTAPTTTAPRSPACETNGNEDRRSPPPVTQPSPPLAPHPLPLSSILF